MKILRCITAYSRHPVFGIVDGDQVRILKGNPMVSIRESGETVPLQDIQRFLPPVAAPNILAIGRNYREHVRESDSSLPDHPVLFLKSTSSLTAHREPVVLPAEAPSAVDYEVELAVVIRDRVKNAPESEALRHVWGYTIAQDISARDCQLKLDQQWARGKSFDTFAPIGPWLETELNPTAVVLRTILNGQVVQADSTASMIFPVASLISYLSRMMTLLPGTIIMTGTPSGCGFARQPPVYLKNGDLLVSEIDGIGRLENQIVSK